MSFEVQEINTLSLDSMVTSLARASSEEILVSGFSNEIYCLSNENRIVWKLSQIDEFCSITVVFVSEALNGVFLACTDSCVYLFNLTSKIFKNKFEGHTSEVLSLVVDQNNQVLFTGSSDTSIKIWSIAKFSIITTYSSEPSSIISLSLSQKELLCAGLSSDTIYIIRYADLEFKFEEFSVSDTDEISCVVVLETVESCFGVGFLNGNIEIWGMDQYKLKELKRHEDRVNVLKTMYVQGMEFMISGSRDFSVIIWRVEDGSAVKVLKNHNHLVSCIETDSDRKEFVSADWNGNIKIFNFNYSS
jgi:WD40 repeat protein